MSADAWVAVCAAICGAGFLLALRSVVRDKSRGLDATLDALLDSDPDDEPEAEAELPAVVHPAVRHARARFPEQIHDPMWHAEWELLSRAFEAAYARRNPRPRPDPNVWDAVDRQILSNPHTPYPPRENQ
jgi:hypothetical protein